MNCVSHDYITKYAIGISNLNLSQSQIDALRVYCIKPDEDEAEGAFKNHFYNPATNLNFRGERSSALTKFEEHYLNSDKGRNIEHLGRAIHFLEDLCCPVHTYYEDLFDSVYRLNQHVDFENTCDKIIHDINPLMIAIDKDYYYINSLKTIGKSCAMKASKLFHELDTDLVSVRDTAERSILLAIQSVAGILIRFFGGSI